VPKTNNSMKDSKIRITASDNKTVYKELAFSETHHLCWKLEMAYQEKV
jgi:hypothetical protein